MARFDRAKRVAGLKDMEDARARSEKIAGYSRAWQSPLLGVLIGAATLGLTYLAHINGRPITSALVAVFGVMGIGALLGTRAGVVAGLAASLTFNIVFTDPAWTFTYSTADDLVPMIALTFSAIASGIIAGRLRDRAIASEIAGRRISGLLRFSQDLQRAVTLRQVEATAQECLGRHEIEVRLFIEGDDGLSSPSGAEWGLTAADELWTSQLPELTSGSCVGFLLKGSERRIGVLVAKAEEADFSPDEIRMLIPLITLAIQRCQLAEQLSQAHIIKRSEQFKTTLLSSVSHDLRTPLAAISASAGSLANLKGKLDEQTQANLLATIQEQCTRLDRFTTKLLSLGRIEGGLDVNEMPVVDAVEVLGGTLARVRRVTNGRPIRRNFVAPSGLVRADESLLEQVFFNVLENAVTHTGKNASIMVTAETLENTILIAVEDDGPGIPSDELERVFERFYQVSSNSGSSSGSGLGLSIAKGFTELIGGTIIATSSPVSKRGTRIEVALPLATPAP